MFACILHMVWSANDIYLSSLQSDLTEVLCVCVDCRQPCHRRLGVTLWLELGKI